MQFNMIHYSVILEIIYIALLRCISGLWFSECNKYCEIKDSAK